jgi:hypothetical protein
VWLIAGIGVCTYATIGILIDDIPGIQALISWLESLVGWWVLLAVFISIIIEGLYFVGSFFPGSSVVVLLAILSQSNSPLLFIATILAIFVGWVISGGINIFIAKKYVAEITPQVSIQDYPFVTWLPSFRANQEVAQTVAGVAPLRVFINSLQIKFFASLFMAGVVLAVAQTIDVSEISNDEGFATLYISATVMLLVGGVQLKRYFKTYG